MSPEKRDRKLPSLEGMSAKNSHHKEWEITVTREIDTIFVNTPSTKYLKNNKTGKDDPFIFPHSFFVFLGGQQP